MTVFVPELAQKQSGAYFTPESVAASMVRWAVHAESDRMLDPSSGDGQFLLQHRNSVGVEQNPISAETATERAPWALVHQGDFFAWANETTERFECAAGNPPFVRYQTFNGTFRRSALDLCERAGARFSGLASLWAPFLVATASLLKRGGRMAFVVPAEIGHAPYAHPLLEYLIDNFAVVHVVAVREKLFPALSEDCWLLYAEGFGEKATHLRFTALDRFHASDLPPAPDEFIDLQEWRQVWARRLRPYLLPRSIRALYAMAAVSSDSVRFRDFARIGIGYVSGHNEFFHLRPSVARRLRIPERFLHASLRTSRVMPPQTITEKTVHEWQQNDEPVMLLRIGREEQLTMSVQSYLDSELGHVARQGYKCRNRQPWYSVPDVQTPDFMLSYMSGRTVNLVRNAAGVTCTNSVHSVQISNAQVAKSRLQAWSTPFVRLSCEIEGHALGGGVLKLEPREAGNVLFPSGAALKGADGSLEEGISVLQRWRHYGD